MAVIDRIQHCDGHFSRVKSSSQGVMASIGNHLAAFFSFSSFNETTFESLSDHESDEFTVLADDTILRDMR